MTQTPRVEEVLESAISERLRNFFTALPGIILSTDSTTGKANIRIRVTNAIEDSKGDKTWHEPVIQNVRIQYPGGSDSSGNAFRLTFPVSPGDHVIYIVSTLPLHDYLNKGYANLDIDPVTFNNLASGWIIPGTPLSSTTTTPQNAMILHGAKVKIGGDTGTEVTFKADTFLSRFDDFLDVLETEINAIALGVGTTIKNAWITTGIKTTNTEVK